MNLVRVSVVFVVLAAVSAFWRESAYSAPELQFPWPTGIQHRINEGNTYGCDTHTNSTRNLYAIDFQFSIGDLVAVTAAGTVVDGESNPDEADERGLFLEIDHGGGFRSRYLHLRETSPWAPGISMGSVVSQGQHIGYSGNTGGVAAHLHFDMQLYVAGVSSAYRAEPLTNVTGFGWYGFSTESGIGTAGCSDAGTGCTPTTCGNIHDASPYWTSLVPWVRNLPANPGFETVSTSPWLANPPAPVTWHASVSNGTAKSGARFLQFNTTAQPGSVYQDIPLEVPTTGDSYIFSIWARAATAASCIDIKTALWALGGTPESASNDFLDICGTAWRLLTTSFDVANSGHTTLRAEVYSNLRGLDVGQNLDVDAAEVIHVKHKNASFERGPGDLDVPEWNRLHPQGGTLWWQRYSGGASGWLLQANKSNNVIPASIYQDVLITTTPGESYTFSIWLRRNGGVSRNARVVLWGLDANPQNAEHSVTYANNIPATWTLYSVTRTIANPGHNKIRAEIYIDSGCCLQYQLDASRLVKN